ncbi:MAG TPA: calcium-binding protein [Tepidisphaeraceae bacterium]|jgi:Ca2+-binding RTX toxin-like protein|nr:calcium-binding protein [Tepidisphaeraceae bacterium]
MIEPLEQRRLLSSVFLKGRTLNILGTDQADDIQIQQQRETETSVDGNVFFIRHLLVTVNGAFIGDFSTTDFDKVVVKLFGGNDFFQVGKKDISFDIDGGDGDDTIYGSLAPDVIRGGAGRNLLYGVGGNDHFISISGADVLTGGNGNDTADFGAFQTPLHITIDDVADDEVPGRTGNVKSDIETVIGGGGADFISANGIANNPVALFGSGGNDTLIGGSRNDTIHGGPGNDSLRGGDGNDFINGDGGRDKIYGENGDDTLMGSGKDPEFIPLPAQQPTDPNTLGGGSDGLADSINGGSGDNTAFPDPFDVLTNIQTTL